MRFCNAIDVCVVARSFDSGRSLACAPSVGSVSKESEYTRIVVPRGGDTLTVRVARARVCYRFAGGVYNPA
jgi:hypothetical protein